MFVVANVQLVGIFPALTGSTSLWLSEFKWAAGTFTLPKNIVYIWLVSGSLNW